MADLHPVTVKRGVTTANTDSAIRRRTWVTVIL